MMSSSKRAAKSKLVPKNEPDETPNAKKTTKRASRNEVLEQDDMSMLIGHYQASAMKKTTESDSSSINPEYRSKILGLVRSQLEARYVILLAQRPKVCLRS